MSINYNNSVCIIYCYKLIILAIKDSLYHARFQGYYMSGNIAVQKHTYKNTPRHNTRTTGASGPCPKPPVLSKTSTLSKESSKDRSGIFNGPDSPVSENNPNTISPLVDAWAHVIVSQPGTSLPHTARTRQEAAASSLYQRHFCGRGLAGCLPDAGGFSKKLGRYGLGPAAV